MSRPDRVFKSAVNAALDRVLSGHAFDNKSALSRDLGISRTTVRTVLDHLEQIGVLNAQGSIARMPVSQDYFDPAETLDLRDSLEAAFMRKISERELVAGDRLVEGHLAREFGVSIQSIREFLINLSRFGFVHKDHQRRWVLEGVTRKYAQELHEVRVMFETRAVENVCALSDEHPFWGGLLRLQQQHEILAPDLDRAIVEFPALDTSFHRFLYSNADNRLIMGFQDAIAMIFNHHYLWPPEDLKEHARIAISDHLAIIDAVLRRDKTRAQRALHDHLGVTQRRLSRTF